MKHTFGMQTLNVNLPRAGLGVSRFIWGGWKPELEAARAYDLALLKFFGPQEPCSGNSPQEELFHKLNFPEEDYSEEIKTMQEYSCADWVAQIRRRSSGFARGVSAFRGVTSHKGKNSKGRWEARIGRVLGNQYIYLGCLLYTSPSPRD